MPKCFRTVLIFAIWSCVSVIACAAPIDVELARNSLIFLTVERTEPSGKITRETGTGFIITSDGYIVTAGHLIGEVSRSSLLSTKVWAKRRSRNSPESPVQLEYLFPACCDLVVLKYPDQGLSFDFLRLADRARILSMRLNDPLTVIGFGLENDLAPANGTLGNKGGNFIDGNTKNIWLINAPVNHGNSGSPVFDKDGYVVGIVKGGIAGAQGSNYFVPIDLIRPALVSLLEVEAQQEVLAASSGRTPVTRASSSPSAVSNPPQPTAGNRTFDAGRLLWPASSIPVCWENPGIMYETEMKWVRDAVTSTWQANSAITFAGWERCSENSTGIRIGIDNSSLPHTKRLGRELSGLKNGVSIDFALEKGYDACPSRKEECIKSISVHVFGHALGFGHTHNRMDTPAD